MTRVATQGRCIHNEGGKDELSLTWTKVDDGPEPQISAPFK